MRSKTVKSTCVDCQNSASQMNDTSGCTASTEIASSSASVAATSRNFCHKHTVVARAAANCNSFFRRYQYSDDISCHKTLQWLKNNIAFSNDLYRFQLWSNIESFKVFHRKFRQFFRTKHYLNASCFKCHHTNILPDLQQQKQKQQKNHSQNPELKARTTIKSVHIFHHLLQYSLFLLTVQLLCPLVSVLAQSSTNVTSSSAVPNTYLSDRSRRSLSQHEQLRLRHKYYTNKYAIRIEGGSAAEADRIALKYGFTNLGPVFPNDEYFLFESKQVRRRSSRRTRSVQTNSVAREPHVQWIEQQVAKLRVKRGFQPIKRDPLSYYHRLKGNEITGDSSGRRTGSHKGKMGHNNRQRNNGNNHNDVVADSMAYTVNDPLWDDMWYLNRAEYDHGMDHNVKEAWELGYTGKGVVVTILDDGLEKTHPDIAPNYDVLASCDVNDSDDDPTPRYELTDENRHGTRCAGEVAAIFNNSLCIVGIAYNARIGVLLYQYEKLLIFINSRVLGIRMLDGDVTDVVEAKSLGHNSHYIDIYSASWGPDDDGRTVDGPARLTRKAFEKGIKEGRRGLGSIFVWASGNGGKDADSCNCDGYTNSIYTLSISSATERGNIPWYSEACSSTLATTYSSGASGEKMIVTTDLHHSCTNAHTGTSASAPLAAGIVALTLQANPNLTWRDLQHIVVRTAKPWNLKAGDWLTNGVGRNVSHSFGYGLMDAGAMVKLAANWTTVPEQRRCIFEYPAKYKTVPHGNRLQLQLYSDGCATKPHEKVVYLEHVQAIINLSAPKRGDIQIYLISPSGTRSTLLAKRARDNSRSGFRDWAFMTTHNWGEIAVGLWTLEIDNDGWDDATLITWELVLWGTVVEVGPNGGTHQSQLTERSIVNGYGVDDFGLPDGCSSLEPTKKLIASLIIIVLFKSIAFNMF
uniref:P/Homo B domain-containing protein n=1 Tax=Syphacia muris TaxID=451379 RepID=A0A0N5AIG8_9BILA